MNTVYRTSFYRTSFYRGGSWFALIGPRAVVALSPDAAPALVQRLWERVRAEEVAFADVVDALTAAGGGSFSAIPPFVAVVQEGEHARIAARGQVTVRVITADDEHEITGAEVTTWSERFVPAITGFEIALEDGSDAALPIVAGIVRAAALARGSATEEPVSAATPGSLSAPGRSLSEERNDETKSASLAQEPDGAGAVTAGSQTAPGRSLSEERSDETKGASLAQEPDAEAEVSPGSSNALRLASLAQEPDGAADRDETPPPADEPEPEPEATDDPADLDDTVLSAAVPVETILPSADTIAAPFGGHTLDFSPQPVARPAAPTADDGDHDGATISLAQARALRGGLATGLPADAQPAPGSTVPEAAAPAPAPAPETEAPVSSVPGITGVPAAVAAAADPAAGARVRLSTGQVIALDRPVVIGRRPQATRSSGATMPHLVAVASPQQDISRSHLEIRPEPDAVVVLDLHTTNGSTLLRPGTDPVRLHPGEQTIVVTGDVIDLGDGVTVAFEDLP